MVVAYSKLMSNGTEVDNSYEVTNTQRLMVSRSAVKQTLVDVDNTLTVTSVYRQTERPDCTTRTVTFRVVMCCTGAQSFNKVFFSTNVSRNMLGYVARNNVLSASMQLKLAESLDTDAATAFKNLPTIVGL